MNEKQSGAWEVSIMKLRNQIGSKYKVTKRSPIFLVSETKIFRSKEEAEKQLKAWLEEI